MAAARSDLGTPRLTHRRMVEADLDAVLAIETAAYMFPWSGGIFRDCLRVGYTTILLGALGYFGLGMPPESPDWGTAIKESSRFIRIFIHPALPPALAMMSFVLGLNLLADALREESLKD